MNHTGILTFLFIDVEAKQRQIITDACVAGSGYSLHSVQMNFLQKKPVFPSEKNFDYIVLHADTLQEINHKIMALFSCFKKAKMIFLCNDSEDFFTMQLFPWFFVLRCSHIAQDSVALKEKLQYLYEKEECYYFQHPDTQRKLHIQDIYFIECNKNYLYINGRENCWKDRATIKYAQDTLSCHGCLLINRGVIVNPAYIEQIHGNQITMRNQRVLYISRGRKKEVYQKCRLHIAGV